MKRREAFPLPTRIDEVSAAWLSAALERFRPGVEVTAAAVKDVIAGTSTKIRLVVEYNDAGRRAGLPPTLIVKGGFEEHSPLFGFMYESEVRCYRDLLPQLDMNAPRCFFADKDPANHQGIVVMEDLAARTVAFLHAQAPLDFNQEARFLDAMARYHAQWWGREELSPGGSLQWVGMTFDDSGREYLDRYLQPEVWASYMGRPRGAAVPRAFHDGARMQAALAALARWHQRYPPTLVHGDTHLGNLYVEPGGEPGFLDMQIRRAPWFKDVAYHLTAALDILDRRQWARELLEHYLRRLDAYGVPAPAFDEAWACVGRELVYGLFIFLINETRFQTESVNTAYTARFAMAAAEHDTFRLLLE